MMMALKTPAVVVLGYWLVLLGWMSVVRGFTSDNETALRTVLFHQYDVSVRPNSSTVVSLTLTPTSLNSIDIKGQTMSISGWWVMSWMDNRLTWNASAHDDISETHVFEDDVWTPSIVVYNSVNDLSAIDEDTIPVRILSSGQLEWSPPGILTVSCNTDVTHFPFDIQTCGVSVKTFGYTHHQVELEADADEIDMNYYSVNGEWDLLKVWTEKANVYNYSHVTFNFKFQRKPEFYGLNLMFPVLMMTVIGLFIFQLPAESGERMGYSLTVMLTFVVLMTLVSDRMPSTTDHTSFFEIYIVLMLVMCALSVVLSIFNLSLYFKDESQPIPACVQAFTRILLTRLVCGGKHMKTQTPNHRRSFFRQVSANQVKVQTAPMATPSESAKREAPSLERDDPKPEEPEVTWKNVSMVMDAFCFRLYCVLFVLLTVIFLTIVGTN